MDKTPPDAPKPPDTLPKKSKLMLAFMALAGMATFAVGVVIAAYAYVNYSYEAVPEGEPREIVFDVKKGSGLSRIASNLEELGAIKSADMFKLVTKLRGNEAAFKAGEFSLTLPASMNDIYGTLSEGKAILYPITIAEGRTSAQIVRQLSTYDWLTADEVAVPPEGTLLPETYLLPRNMSYSEVIARMKRDQKDVIDRLWDCLLYTSPSPRDRG